MNKHPPCPMCDGGTLVDTILDSDTFTTTIHGVPRELTVYNLPVWKCHRCGSIFHDNRSDRITRSAIREAAKETD